VGGSFLGKLGKFLARGGAASSATAQVPTAQPLKETPGFNLQKADVGASAVLFSGLLP
jgi:hypothetical protein